MPATAIRPRKAPVRTIAIRESVFSGPDGLKVDRDKGIIYGVKILGRESSNTHGMEGATKGSRYTREALRRGRTLYEGALSNKNHRRPGDGDRPIGERIGWFTNVRDTDDGIFGDYNLLLSDPDTPKLLEAAERNPRCFAMSHDALGSGRVVDGWFEINDIPEVNSVDAVADGGTNVSLFESRRREHRPMKITFRKLLESSPHATVKAKLAKPHYVRLLEMDGLGDVLTDEAPPEEAAEMTWKDHVGELLKALASDESLSPEEMRKKANAALKLLEDEKAAPASADAKVDESEEDDAAGDDEDDDEKKKKKPPADAKESKSRKRSSDPHVRQLQERLDKAEAKEGCRQLCESLEFTPTSDQFETLLLLPGARRKSLIADLKAASAKPAGKQPRSAPPGGTRVQESRGGNGTPEIKTAGDFASALRG